MLSELKSLLLKSSVKFICVDYFDTLVERHIAPESVKVTWAVQLQEKLELDSSVNVYHLRHEIEKSLCEKNFQKNNAHEFKYHEMLTKLFHQISSSISLELEEFNAMAMNIELSIEKGVQILQSELVNLLKLEKSNGKKLVCVSDFYFSEKMMRELMNYHGIEKLFDEVITSSEYMVTKRAESLYAEVSKVLGDEKFFMIGDNRHSDYDVPIKYGYEAFHLDKAAQHESYQNYFEISKKSPSDLMRLIAQNSRNDSHFGNLYLPLFLFIHNLHKALVSDGIEEVFFLAREGEFLKKLFDEYLNVISHSDAKQLKTHYFLASRRSTLIPSLKNLEEENFETIFRQYRNISAEDFLKSLCFTENNLELAAGLCGSEFTKRQDDFPTSKIWESLKSSSDFVELYESHRTNSSLGFQKYLDSFDCGGRKTAFVDVGWKGTIQDNIYNYFNGKEIRGYYLGLVAQGLEAPLNVKKGILFNVDSAFDLSSIKSAFNENRALFEVVLGASHGTTAGYDLTGKPKLHNEPIEERLYEEKIRPIQEEIFANYEAKLPQLIYSPFSSKDLYTEIAHIYAGFIFSPNNYVMDFFNTLTHVENFGVFEVTRFDLEKAGFAKKCTNLCKFLLNPRKFLGNCWWRSLHLYNSGLSFLVPVYRKYRFMNLRE